VELHELGDIKLGLLEDLALADEDILDREDALALLLDLLRDGLRNELLDEVAERGTVGFRSHNIAHLLADFLQLRGVGVRGGLDLIGLTGGESDAEHAAGVAVGSFHFDHGLDGGLPLLDQGAELVTGHSHTVEIGEAVASLDILDHQRHLTVSLIVIVVQIGKIDLDDTVHETVRGDLSALGTGHEGLAALALAEVGRGLDVIPFLQQEGVAGLLLLAFLAAFGKALVLSNSHGGLDTFFWAKRVT